MGLYSARGREVGSVRRMSGGIAPPVVMMWVMRSSGMQVGKSTQNQPCPSVSTALDTTLGKR